MERWREREREREGEGDGETCGCPRKWRRCFATLCHCCFVIVAQVIYVDANGNQVQPQAVVQVAQPTAPQPSPSASPPDYVEPEVQMDNVNGATPMDEPSASEK